ncbi:uncharacterized protein LOC126409870 isoform X1 [Nymphaea colorata]|nr:uncharacterized protein LOC126409870 isoform X1 [Nymphaea colorata]
MLQTTREKAESSIVDCRQIAPAGDEVRPPPALQDSACNVLIDDLLFQVEAQESILQDLDGLCATAEAICDAHEESIRQSLFDLPVWADPLSIVKDLSVLNADNVQEEWGPWKELSRPGGTGSGLSLAGLVQDC